MISTPTNKKRKNFLKVQDDGNLIQVNVICKGNMTNNKYADQKYFNHFLMNNAITKYSTRPFVAEDIDDQ